MSEDKGRSWPPDVLNFVPPRWYGRIPSAFGAPLGRDDDDLEWADVAVFGIPWQAPIPSDRIGPNAAAFLAPQMTPQNFRENAIKYGGYLPELDIDLFSALRFIDCGNVDIVADIERNLREAHDLTARILAHGAIPVTIGGMGGVGSFPVVQAISQSSSGPVAVINLDAHGDNLNAPPDDPYAFFAASWADKIFDLPNIVPSQYHHLGLRGPRNDPGTLERFWRRGLPRENMHTYMQIRKARQSGFSRFVRDLAQRALHGASAAWIALDLDVMDMSVCPDFADEPLGINAEELVEICFEVGRAAGRDRFKGISVMAMPHDAPTLHWLTVYAIYYALAGMLCGEGE